MTKAAVLLRRLIHQIQLAASGSIKTQLTDPDADLRLTESPPSCGLIFVTRRPICPIWATRSTSGGYALAFNLEETSLRHRCHVSRQNCVCDWLTTAVTKSQRGKYPACSRRSRSNFDKIADSGTTPFIRPCIRPAGRLIMNYPPMASLSYVELPSKSTDGQEKTME